MPSVGMEDYMKMIGLKTAVLIACSAKMGALIAGAPVQVCEALYRYGYELGLAFQVADDYLDAYGDSKVFGKPIGGDILNGKKSWLTVRAMEKGAEGLAEALSEPSGDDPAGKIARVMALYQAVDVAADAQAEIARLHRRALSAAAEAVSGEGYGLLRRFADSLLGRTK